VLQLCTGRAPSPLDEKPGEELALLQGGRRRCRVQCLRQRTARLCMARAPRSQPLPCHAVHPLGVGVHCRYRLTQGPCMPGGSPHALRTQAPSADHICTIHAPWWGQRAALEPLGLSCHWLQAEKRVHSWMVACGLHGPPFSAPTPMLECPQTGLHNEPSMGAGDPQTGERQWFKVEDIAKSVVSGTCLPPHTTPRSSATTVGSARPRTIHRCKNGAK